MAHSLKRKGKPNLQGIKKAKIGRLNPTPETALGIKKPQGEILVEPDLMSKQKLVTSRGCNKEETEITALPLF